MPQPRADSSVDLLLRAQVGDEVALNDLLARYLPRLQRWASRRLPGALRTMLDTGDLVQDAIVKALPRINTVEVRTDRALQLYLQRAVKNRIIDLHRRASRRPPREEIPEDAMASDGLPDAIAIQSEAFARYKRALASLAKTER